MPKSSSTYLISRLLKDQFDPDAYYDSDFEEKK